MRPPARLHVGPHQYTVNVDAVRCRDLGVRGQTDADALAILLNPALPISMQRDTLLHELLHALFDVQGTDVSDRPLLDDDEEERLVRGLAPLLLDALRRNPRLVTFLLER
jgi:hypothetical protein